MKLRREAAKRQFEAWRLWQFFPGHEQPWWTQTQLLWTGSSADD